MSLENESNITHYQPSFLPELTAQFPSTRYQGSKVKLVDWIWEQIADLEFETCLDIFGGTGAVGYRLKQANKQVTYNDLLRFNYFIGLALIENRTVRLEPQEVERLLQPHPEINYPTFIADNFQDIYFTDEENVWLDQTITNIYQLEQPYKFALAFFALCQACIIKRPFNLFHRKNLYLRLAEVKRSFGNKSSWDKPFEDWFRHFVTEVNQAVFDNSQSNQAIQFEVMDVPGQYDLVYIDSPYISGRGVAVDYYDFYHFLEGLTMYEVWDQHIDYQSKHRRLERQPNPWADKKKIYTAFDRLFERFQNSILVVSYRSDGIPTEKELIGLLEQYQSRVQIAYFGHYQYVLSKNSKSKEILLIGHP